MLNRRAVSVVAGALALGSLLPAASADAASTAQVRDVDKYNHGKVQIVVDGVSRTLSYGHSTGFFTVTPVKSGNDGISVTSLRYSGCGEGDAGNFFDVGHKYRVVVYHPYGLRCQLPGGGWVKGPGFKVVQVS